MQIWIVYGETKWRACHPKAERSYYVQQQLSFTETVAAFYSIESAQKCKTLCYTKTISTIDPNGGTGEPPVKEYYKYSSTWIDTVEVRAF